MILVLDLNVVPEYIGLGIGLGIGGKIVVLSLILVLDFGLRPDLGLIK
jgi:hypothetical protein